MRGLTGSKMTLKRNGQFPLTLALSPRGKVVQMENQLRGERGQSHRTFSLILDGVTYMPFYRDKSLPGWFQE